MFGWCWRSLPQQSPYWPWPWVRLLSGSAMLYLHLGALVLFYRIFARLSMSIVVLRLSWLRAGRVIGCLFPLRPLVLSACCSPVYSCRSLCFARYSLAMFQTTFSFPLSLFLLRDQIG